MQINVRTSFSPIRRASSNNLKYSPIQRQCNSETGLTPMFGCMACHDSSTSSPNTLQAVPSVPSFQLTPRMDDSQDQLEYLALGSKFFEESREEIIHRFYELLKQRRCSLMYGNDMLYKIAQSMEESLFEYFSYNDEAYRSKYRDVCHYMSIEKNNLADRILAGLVNTLDLPIMTIADLGDDEANTLMSSV